MSYRNTRLDRLGNRQDRLGTTVRQSTTKTVGRNDELTTPTETGTTKYDKQQNPFNIKMMPALRWAR